MNHQKIYEAIIKRAQSENRKKLRKKNPNYVYYEKHHIFPRCLGGKDEESNLVLLTAKEHYISHELLVYIYNTNRKLALALMRMSGNTEKYKVSARDYARAKELLNNIPMSEETKEKLRKAISGVKHPQWRNELKSIYQTGTKHKKYSEEGRKNCSNAQKKLYENGYQSNFKNLKGKSPWNLGKINCRIWMYNEKMNKTKLILNEMVEEFLKNEWKIGRKK
jgi:hypothetical protein